MVAAIICKNTGVFGVPVSMKGLQHRSAYDPFSSRPKKTQRIIILQLRQSSRLTVIYSVTLAAEAADMKICTVNMHDFVVSVVRANRGERTTYPADRVGDSERVSLCGMLHNDFVPSEV